MLWRKPATAPQQTDIEWNETLKDWDKETTGWKDANELLQEDMNYEMTYRNKPIPRSLLVRWEDRYPANTGNSSYTHFAWKLPVDLKDYNYMTLLAINYNLDYFENMGSFVNVGIEELNAGRPVLTGSSQFIPTFVVPSMVANGSAPFLRENSYVCQSRMPSNRVNIRCRDVTQLTVNLGDETGNRLDVVAVLPGSDYYCNLLLYLE
jgi:hypothetical protein